MRPPRVTASSGAASSKTLNQLRALGYLGPADAKTSTNVPELSSLPDPKDKIEEQNLLHSAMMSAAALRQLGELEFKSGEYRKAVDHLERARKAHPDDALAALYEGQALAKLGDSQGARNALEVAVTRLPGELDARVLLAHIDLKSGDRVAAEDQFEAVLLLDPVNREALLGLAEEASRGPAIRRCRGITGTSRQGCVGKCGRASVAYPGLRELRPYCRCRESACPNENPATPPLK